MSIVKMKRLRLIGLQEGREELLRELQSLGCVQVDTVTAAQDDPTWAGLVHPDSRALEEARDRLEQTRAALEVLQKAVPEKKGLLDPLPQATEGELFDEAMFTRTGEAAERLCRLEKELAELNAEGERLTARRKGLEPWVGLDVPLDTPSTSSVSVIFGSVPVRTDLAAMEAALGDPGQLCAVYPAGSDRESRYLLLVCHKSAEDEVMTALRGFGFGRVTFRDITGTALANDVELSTRYEANCAKAKEVTDQIAAFGKDRRELELSADRALQEVRRQEAASRLMDSDAAFVLSGWFPAESEEQVRKVLDCCPCAWECADPTEEEYPQVPVKLQNNPITAAVNPVTEMYSLPAYDSVDPNPLMLPFFVLFFGFMMNDIAYGLLMILGTGIYLKLKKPREGTRNMMTLFLLCGISSVFWGCLTGSFFGDFLPKLFSLTGVDDNFVWFWPPLFTPVNDIITVMVGSIALGVIQVFSGMAISMVEKFRHGEAMDAITGEIAWWFILLGAAGAIGGSAVGLPPVVGTIGTGSLILGLVLLLAGNLIRSKGLGGIVGFGGDIYNGISGYFSDILSYLRLMALMMAGSIIASVFNTLGSVFGLVPFIVVSLIGNTLNLVLNLLGCYVHTLRLQCLEFFGRFYKDGGRAFRPLAVETQYVNVLKEEL